ncbi:MAG: hypothetical protein IPJ74_10865 [Saprospiraceae bacterium]|nr:hypothetical protein [Saprospiraceae bacterium]
MRQIFPKKNIIKTFIILLPLVLVALQWITDTVKTDNLIFEVPKIAEIQAFETRYLYFYLHLFALIPVLSMSFDRRVHFLYLLAGTVSGLISCRYFLLDLGHLQNGSRRLGL